MIAAPAPGPIFPIGWETIPPPAETAPPQNGSPRGDLPLIPPWAGSLSGVADEAAAGPASLKPTWRDLGAGGGGKRFAALSTLPAGQRLPAKRTLPLAKHLREDQAARAAATDHPPPLPSPETGLVPSYPAAPQYPATPPPSMVLPQVLDRQLGFNCPSCFTVLIIRDPAHYDGSPAPCPTCHVRIIPPRCLPDSPFTLVRPARNLPALPAPGGGE